MKRLRLMALLSLAAFCAHSAHAAFIVEPDNVAPAGKANDHFTTPIAGGFSLSTGVSTAVGLSGNQSAFGNPQAAPDLYTFTYTPLTDVDNTVLVAGTALGTHRIDPAATLVADAQTATGLVGGATGTYKVFITWPNSGNVDAAGSTITVNSNGAPIVLNPISQNGDPAFPLTFTAIGEAGKNKWLLLGKVQLTSGTPYTVTMQANSPTFTSQRVHGVMWELQPPIPEPASAGLAAMALLGLAAARRRR